MITKEKFMIPKEFSPTCDIKKSTFLRAHNDAVKKKIMCSMKFSRSKTSESLFLISHNDGIKEKFMIPKELNHSKTSESLFLI